MDLKIVLAQLNVHVGDLQANADKIIHAIEQGRHQGADLVAFHELTLCGYPPLDLLLYPHFYEEMERQMQRIAKATKGTAAMVGTIRKNPESIGKTYFNTAAILIDGEIVGYQDKTLLPTYDVFNERRYFSPSQELRCWDIKGFRVGVTICEDIWQNSARETITIYKRNPIEELVPFDIDLMVNLSASPFSMGRFPRRLNMLAKAAGILQCPVVYTNQVGGYDSLIFDGVSFAVNEAGQYLGRAKAFVEDLWMVDFATAKEQPLPEEDQMELLYHALVLGLRDYFHKQNFSQACLGLSGGIDSALVACLAADALGKENVVGVIMPSRYSSEGSIRDAEQLAQNLGIRTYTLPIEKPFSSYLELLEPAFEGKEPDATEENLQARIRGMLLMALSNKHGWIVLTTGNKSELAMGYSTLYGDMCGGIGVISDVSKKDVYALSRWLNCKEERIPESTINKPPSAELRPEQKDSDTLPDYALIDMFLTAYVEEHQDVEKIAERFNWDLDFVQDLAQKIHRNEFKRKQAAPGLRVTEKAFTVGRCFPIVQGWI